MLTSTIFILNWLNWRLRFRHTAFILIHQQIPFNIDGPQADNNITITTRVTVLVQGLSSSSETLSINAKETEDSISLRDSQDSLLQENTNRPNDQSLHFQDLPEQALYAEVSKGVQPSQQNQNISMNEIPKSIEEEDWEDQQFADADPTLITNNNTHGESKRLRKDYSEQLLSLSDQDYYSKDTTTSDFQYQIPEPGYYSSDTRPRPYQRYQNPNRYLPPPPDPDNIRRWYGRGCGRAKRLELHGHRLFGEKTHSLESQIACKKRKNKKNGKES